jgi:uncharacterized protein (TIGR00255 family)
MLISMTGFGQGEASNKGHTVSVEIRTVNHRFLDYSFKLPRMLNAHERDMKEQIRKRIARGRIYVTVSVESDTAARNVTVNEPVMERYLEQLNEFAAAHGIEGNVDINTLAQLPDAVTVDETEADVQALWPLAEKALEGALELCRQMRTTEGKALEKDLTGRMKTVGETVVEIEKLAPGNSARHAEAFQKRIAQLIDDAAVDSDRLTTEIALMADRLDVTEEITRLHSHIAQFNKTLETGGEVSKKLTYLLQEMHREASTIGAKASDSEITRHVVALKEETQKLREQVQNLE